MARYIDADKLTEYFYCAGAIMVYGDYIPAIISRIKITPTADVVEVRHGEWIHSVKECDANYYYHCFTCSLCGRIVTKQYEEEIKDLPYCHCGAKMDGKPQKEVRNG